MDMFSLRGKVAALSGASTGIGRHLAGTLARAGATVMLGARSVDKLDGSRRRKYAPPAAKPPPRALDVCDLRSVTAFFDAAHETIRPGRHSRQQRRRRSRRVHVRHARRRRLGHGDRYEPQRRVVDDARTDAPSRRARRPGAVVVNISSITSERTTKGIFPYAVSKAGVNQATRVMALEGAKHNIRVNALAPGYIYTNVSKALLDSDIAAGLRASGFRNAGSASSAISTDRCCCSRRMRRAT